MDTIAKRPAYARKTARMTQEKLAEVSGVKQSDISKIESGKIVRPTGTVALAKALRCNPFWLDDGSGEPYGLPNWPFELFTPEEYAAIPADYRKRIENELAGEVQRSKQRRNGTFDP